LASITFWSNPLNKLSIGVITSRLQAVATKIKAFLAVADNQIARGKVSGGVYMRIDLHVRSNEVRESIRSTESHGSAKGKTPPSKSSVQGDEAKLWFSPARVKELERTASEVPDVRQERVGSLKSAIQDGRYEPPPEHVANAMLTDALTHGDLLRR
jgi:flagellar biosynthesis anti-sigma factor FlgM